MSKTEWRLWKNEILKDCRYCQSNEVELTTKDGTAFVECRTCGARGSSHSNSEYQLKLLRGFDFRDMAVLEWNGANE